MGVTPRLRPVLLFWFACVFLPPILLPCTKASRDGSCFKIRYKIGDGCGHFLRSGVTKERCCTGHYRRAWSSDDSPTYAQGYGPQGHTIRNTSSSALHNQIWIESERPGRSGQRHSRQDCQPCITSCKHTRCGEDRKCVLRNGIPKCVCSPKCHLQHKEAVCGTDGRTYSSECQLLKRSCRKKQRLLVAHSGPCQTCSGVRCRNRRTCVMDELLTPRCQKCPKSCPETRRKRSICATDDVTYTSKCLLKMASCEAGVTIKKAYKGPCQENATCDNVKCWRGETCLWEILTKRPKCQWCGDLRHCPSTATHICASDKNTYQSWCALRHASCRKGTALIALTFHHCDKNSTKLKLTRNNKCLSSTSRSEERTQKLNRLQERKEKRRRLLDTSVGGNSSISSDVTLLEMEVDEGSRGAPTPENARKRNSKRRKGSKKAARRKRRKKKRRNDC